jgi:hypothetical protein
MEEGVEKEEMKKGIKDSKKYKTPKSKRGANGK